MDTLTDVGAEPESPASRRVSRRQYAYYPNMNSTNKPTKPFSRSAAKRESVMALGSIEHLQHYFTKTGIAAEKNPSNKPNSGMVPAIGGLTIKTGRPWPVGVPEFQLPPSPVVPQIVQPATSPYVKTYEIDPENLRPSVIDDLGAVEHSWWLSGVEQPDHLSVHDAQGSKNTTLVDVLEVLRTTTHAVRSVRNYLLSLPDDGPTPVKPHFQFRTSVLSAAPVPRRQVSQPDSVTDPLSRIRRSALDVLTVLRSVEEAARLPLSDDAYDAQSDHGDHTESLSVSGSISSNSLSSSASGSGSGSGSASSLSRATSPDFLGDDVETPVSISYVHVGGRHGPVPVWEDEEEFDLNQLSEKEREKRERWDERLVLGGGWLYRQNVTREGLAKERDVVARYLDAVDEVLFGGRKDGRRGWVREREREEKEKERRGKSRRVSAGDAEFQQTKRSNRRVTSAGMLDAMRGMVLTEEPEDGESFSEAESVDDEVLPDWAKRNLFADDDRARLHALLKDLIPSSLIHLLPPSPTDRAALLQALSSGQLLCVAYNAGVRKSRKPWGYVSKDAIHDIAALEAQSLADGEHDQERVRVGWTFRRTDNLRLWAAALKLRYALPVHTPVSASATSGRLTPGESTTPIGSPSTPVFRFPTGEPPITFDAPLIARHEPGWEGMLERLAERWMRAVVDEKRGHDARG